MKIGYVGIDLPEGKIRYEDATLLRLVAKDKPKKVTPYFAELLKDELVHCDAIIIPRSSILDLLILDMERVETRHSRVTGAGEQALLERALRHLEEELPLCDLDVTESERGVLASADPYSLKPVLRIAGNEEVNDLIAAALEAAGYTFFYTSGPKESHAWLVRTGATMLACAEKIHTDLARGFIRAEVVALEDYLACHSFNECRSKGVAEQLDRDAILAPDRVIEFKFNV